MKKNRIIFYMIAIISMLICFLSGILFSGKQAKAQASYCVALDLVSTARTPPTPANCKDDFVFMGLPVHTGNTPFYGEGWQPVYTGLCIGPY